MKSSKDVKLADKGIIYYFKYLDWDSAFFGRQAFILDTTASSLRPSARIADLVDEHLPNSFITAKVDAAANRELFDFMQESGFKYIDTEITLRHEPVNEAISGETPGLRILELSENVGLPYEELGAVYSLTRFHYDSHITKDQADNVWVSYIKNFEPSPHNRMFIASVDNEVAGAILVNETTDGKTAALFFVSVVKTFQKSKIGSKLLQHIVKSFPNYELVTGTQVRNVRALNFYIKNGFSIIDSTSTVWHRWS